MLATWSFKKLRAFVSWGILEMQFEIFKLSVAGSAIQTETGGKNGCSYS